MRKPKMRFSILLAFALIFSALPTNFAAKTVSAEENVKELNLVDPEASDYTKALFAYFQDISGEKVLFGHQHATDEGETLTNEPPRTASEQSEVFNAVGDYPAIFGWDTGSIYGREKPGVEGEVEQSIENLSESMIKAHELGGIVTLSMHPDNFVTGGPYDDTTGDVVENILPGGSKNAEFNEWLDDIATLAHKVKDVNGKPIPIIFRPFHEQTGSWFWWGAHETTPEQYKAIFRYTVEYLRDVKDVHNILYGFSPGAGPAGDKDRYMETYPGDEYVDIFGIDNYDSQDNAGSDEWLNGLVTDLAMISKIAEEKGKIAALTEFGYSSTGMNQEGNTLDWYTKLLNEIKNDKDASKIAYLHTWANFGWPDNMFVPYKDVNDDLGGDHELLPDFQTFAEEDYSAFRNDIAGEVYTDRNINLPVAENDPVAHVASPATGSTITSDTTTFRVRVLNDEPEKVVYTVEGSDTEHELTLDQDSNYYTADWSPSPEQNGEPVNITVKVIHSEGTVVEETVKVYVKASDIPLKTLTFDNSIDAIKSNGTWPEAEVTAFEHVTLDGDGKLKYQVSRMDSSETWQELKMELTDVSDVDLDQVNQVKFDALIPVSAGDGSIQGIVQLPPDWDTKNGIDETKQSLSELETITIDGVDYKQYQATVDVEVSDDTNGIALSLVGDGLDLTDAIYVDNIELVNTYVEKPKDPLLVDDFESYLGDDMLLNNSYSSNGDPITLSLSTENKKSGDYGLEYNYTLGSMGYAGAETSLEEVDWTGTNAFQFWLKNDEQPDNDLTIQIQISGISFESNMELAEANNGIVTIPFSEFEPAEWEDKSDVVIDKEKLENVTQFSIYTGGEQGEGTLYFDDMKAVTAGDAPEVPDASDTDD